MKRECKLTGFTFMTMVISALILVGVILLSESWTALKDEGFAIYLTKEDISPAQISALSYVSIDVQPIIAISDIISYDANTHEITLSPSAFDRVSDLEVSVSGMTFVVCVNKRPIYCGAFWTPISSISFDGVTIFKPLNSQDPKVIKLELGYPSSSFYDGEDPRIKADIMESLIQAGKLITVPSNMTLDKLPHSMKGYELYSWLENNQWHFILITGTNRIKTLKEIKSTANIISQDGWVQIHVIGVDAIKTVLSRLPPSEDILWLSELRSEQTLQGGEYITIPIGSTMDTIKEHAGQCGLSLLIDVN